MLNAGQRIWCVFGGICCIEGVNGRIVQNRTLGHLGQEHGAILLHEYANPLKRQDTSESINLYKYLILLDSYQIHATRCTSRRTGPQPRPERGFGSFSVAARRLRVEWSGTARSRSSSWRMEPISPSVWRSAKRNTARSVRAVAIARSE